MLSARAHSNTRPVTLAIVGVLAIVGLLPLDPGLRYIVVLSMTWAIAALGLDLFAGYLGQPHFGQFAFVAMGAYSITALRVTFHVELIPAVLLTVVLVGVLSAIIGAATVQLRHFGAALTTFFFAFVVFHVLGGNALDPITHSESGLPVPPLALGDLDLSAQGPWLYWLVWLLLLAAVLVCANYANSRSGRALRLIKQSEAVAGTLGFRVRITKLSAFVFSSILAAIAGLPLSLALGYLAPESFDPSQSIILFAMLVVGGIGSLAGPLIGALLFTGLPQAMQQAGALEAVLFALIFLFFVIVFPTGLFGLVEWAGHRVGADRGLAALRDAAGRRWSRRTSALEGAAGSGDWQGLVAHPATRGQEALVAEGVTVVFGGLRALDDVSFTVRAGTIHALVGPNGAGKTTFLNCVSGLQRPTAGRILVDGDDVSRSPSHTVRAQGVARTFQNPSLVSDLSVVENVMLGLYGSHRWSLARDLAGGWASRGRQRTVSRLASEALRQVGLTAARLGVDAGDLSLGEQKVVDIARAIAGGSRLLLLDEPTSGLGDREIANVADLLRRLRDAHGLTILVIAHNVGFVQEISDVVTVLDFGRVLAEGEPRSVIEDPEVMAAYLGEAEEVPAS
jgi:branched-chain amino acid transport system permease protein